MRTEKLVLGFSLGHDTGAAIVSSERGLLVAVNEERITRIKQTKAFPINAIKECLKIAKLQLSDIDLICYTNYEKDTIEQLVRREKEIPNSSLIHLCKVADMQREKPEDFIIAALCTIECLKPITCNIGRIDHHVAHVASVAPFIESKQAFILSMDGFGDDKSVLVTRKVDSTIFGIATRELYESIGLVYQFTTGALGFTMNLHEGKITGMAARGDKFEALHIYQEYEDFMLKLRIDIKFHVYYCNEHNIAFDNNFPIANFTYYECMKTFLFEKIKEYMKLKNNSQQAMFDVCAAVQAWTESAVLNFIDSYIKPLNDDNSAAIGLVGGLFANVELNRKIAATGYFKQVFIFPNMGDGGLCVGAAYRGFAAMNISVKPTELDHVFFGHNVTNEEFFDLAVTNSLIMKDYLVFDSGKHKYKILAQLIANGFIVANVEDEMEYGPRALCHRSIHFNCDNPDVSLWLNKQLGRTETMPFAPVITHNNALKSFKDYNKITEYAAKFMTMNFLATDFFKNNCPGAVHVDGTVRAQVVHENEIMNNTIYKTLEYYYKLTDRVAFINTSFNKHGEPIVMTAKEAVERFEESNIHYLFINNMLLTNPKLQSLPKFGGEYA